MDTKLIINVGRQFGSGGKSVAEAVGKLTGLPVFDSELLTRAAQESGFSPELFKRSDEKKRVLGIGGILSAGSLCGTSFNGLSDAELFNIQSRVITDIASKGGAVFVGRASNYVLRNMVNCVDVFVSAPLSVRKLRVAERLGLSLEEAEKLIAKSDRSREEYYNFFTFGNWGAASDYDICLNSSTLGIEGTAEFILDFARKAGKL